MVSPFFFNDFFDFILQEDTTDLLFSLFKMSQDISKWNVSKVTTLSKTFDGASVFNSDLSAWDVSKVSGMYEAFRGASLFNSDVSKWNTSKVTHLGHTFEQAAAFNSGKSYFIMFEFHKRHN